MPSGTTLCYKVCQWLVVGLWFSPDPLDSSINKIDCHKITYNIVESDIKHHKTKPNQPMNW